MLCVFSYAGAYARFEKGSVSDMLWQADNAPLRVIRKAKEMDLTVIFFI